MGMEYSPARRKRMAKKRQAQRAAGTWGGPVEVRRIGDPAPRTVLPSEWTEEQKAEIKRARRMARAS